MNLNEAQCTLLYMMNSQLAQAEVIQSSQPYVLCEVLIQSVIKKRHGGITVTTAFDRGGIFGLYALCYKIFFKISFGPVEHFLASLTRKQ